MRSSPDALVWYPRSLISVLGQGGYAGFATTVAWFAIIAVCVWWAMVAGNFPWNLWPAKLFGVQLVFGFYLPWSVCVLLVMWFGLEWAAVPAFLATLFGTLHSNMPLDIAVVNALHNPLAMAVYFVFYCGLSQGYALRSAKSWLWFAAASLVAALVSSIGAFISEYNTAVSAAALWASWWGWWPNAWLQSLLIDAPLIWLCSPAVERLKTRYFPAGSHATFSMQKLILVTSVFILCLSAFILVDARWTQYRVGNILASPLSRSLRDQIQAQLTLQNFVIWVLALVLATVSLGGAILAGRRLRQLRMQAQQETLAAQAAQQRSEARFRHFFDDNPAPMWVYEPHDGRFLEVNDAALRQYGYAREEFLGMTIFDICSPQEAARLRSSRANRPLDHNWEAGEWRHRRKDGSSVDVEVHVSSMRLDGRVVHLALMYDVTPRRKAAALTEQRAHELRLLAAASLELAGAQSLDEVLRISAERARQLTGTNVAMLRCRWNTPDAEIDRHVSLAPSYPRASGDVCALDDEALYVRLLTKCPIFFTRDELQQHPWFGDARLTVQGRLPLDGLLAAPLTSGGIPAGILAVSDKIGGEFDAQDQALITQLAQIASVSIENLRLNQALHEQMQELEQRVVERTAELDASNRELDAFAYSVAHDLRAPLRAVHGFANAVEEDYAAVLDDDGRNYLARIVAAAQHMDALIQDLLAYSRIGRINLVLESVPLDEVLRDALADLSGEVRSSGAAISVQVPALMVRAHRGTLRQVLLNLVSNAIKFVAAGKRPEIGIRAWADNGQVRLAVADNGIGIAPEHHERIFNVFERLHGTEAYPGTGVGLSIVKKGLARMHGEISLQSGPGGSTFTLTLKEFAHGA